MRRLPGLGAALCLVASAPPGWFPGAGLLVFPGWMGFYALCTAEDRRRPLLAAYLVGLAHVLCFSFSIRHVMVAAWLAIGAAGGLYYLLTAAWTRAAARYVPAPLAFGLALAGSCWMRAHFTEIQYPHVQPAHCLYHWPALLGSLAWGGEVLANLCVGALAAATVDLYRAWRLARPDFRRSRLVFVVALACGLLALLPRRSSAPSAVATTVRLLLVEPGFSPDDFMDRFRGQAGQARYRQLQRERVLRPTLAAAGPAVQAAPDLVVWPESVYIHGLSGSETAPRLWWEDDRPLRLARGCRLLAGTLRLRQEPLECAVAALLTDHRGVYLGHHEKRRLVPGGEHAPFLGWLPESVSDQVRRLFESAMGQPLSEVTPGGQRPLLEVAGLPFGAMICYDNAFPEVSADLVGRGARFLVVLSNEAWYRGGDELEQMVAMSVCRALETGVPLVRCTVDGASVVVGADGRLRQRLPDGAAAAAGGKILPVELRVPETGEAALPWLGSPLLWLAWLSLLSLIVRPLRSWGRLLRAGPRKDPDTPADPKRATSGP